VDDKLEILYMRDIKKYYDGECIISIDSLSIKKGTICGYLGKNGAGKSTTIKMLMGIIIPDEGEVFFQDEIINYHNPHHKGHIGYCPDYPAVFEKLSVIEHLHFIAFLYGKTNVKEIESKINKYLKHFEIEKYKNTLIKNLSRGNKQKIAIISSLIHEPSLLLYDEPTLGLDPLSIKQFKTLLKDYTTKGGTVFLSSHSLNTIEEIADTVSIINNGILLKKNISVSKIRETLTSVEDYLISVVEGQA
jgi:ABC-2 type transport system ATP-binding protein